MVQTVTNPETTFNVVTRQQQLGLEDHRNVLVGQMLTGDATAGARLDDLPRTAKEINDLFGEDSHMAMMARSYRRKNPVTNCDVIAYADAGGGTAATGSITFTGTATGSASIQVILACDTEFAFTVDVVSGDTAEEVRDKLASELSLSTALPISYVDSTSDGVLALTAKNKGKVGNSYPIAIKGRVPGISWTISGFSGGATDPDTSGATALLDHRRYQGIAWPEAYSITALKTWLDSRRNIENDIMDGVAFTYRNTALATVKAETATLNTSEIVVLGNKPNADAARATGPHVLASGDVLAAEVTGLRSLRFEDGVSITHIVATNAPTDQFGGIHTASLPYFNTPVAGHVPPITGTGYTYIEQRELEGSGVTVLGAARENNGILLGDVVTTWQSDVAGNEDDTWKYLNWRDTHFTIREYYQRNFQKRFAQHRLTTGVAVAGLAQADDAILRAYALQLFQELGEVGLTVKGREARVFFEENLVWTIKPEERTATMTAVTPMVSQLGRINGTIQFTFEA